MQTARLEHYHQPAVVAKVQSIATSAWVSPVAFADTVVVSAVRIVITICTMVFQGSFNIMVPTPTPPVREEVPTPTPPVREGLSMRGEGLGILKG